MREMHNTLYDEFPGLKTFLDHMDPSAKRDNVYIIQCEDMDGNITDTKYGLNLIPDVGFNAITTIPKYNSDGVSLCYLRICDDSRHWDPDTEQIVHITTSYNDAQIECSWKSNPNDPTAKEGVIWQEPLSDYYAAITLYDAEYDSDSHIIKQNVKLGTFIYDYNKESIDDDMTITHMFLGSYNNDGTYHLKSEVSIYDESGSTSYFIKHMNERVTVTVIITGWIHENLITRAYENGIYTVINPGLTGMIYYGNDLITTSLAFDIFSLNGYTRTNGNRNRRYQIVQQTYPVDVNNYINADSRYCYTGTRGYNSGLMQNHCDNYYFLQTDTPIVLNDPRIYVSKTVMTPIYGVSSKTKYYQSAYWICTFEKLPESEMIAIDPVYTDTSYDSNFGKSFARFFNSNTWNGYIPCVDFNMTGCKAWNHATQDWDIDIGYTNAANAYYDNPFVDVYSINPNIYFHIDNKKAYVRILPDIDPNEPNSNRKLTSIEYLDETSPAPLYAADKYWDVSTWSPIPDPANIPQEYQSKPYYITIGKSNGEWIPTFNQTVHHLNAQDSTLTLPSIEQFSENWIGFKPVMSFDTTNHKAWFFAQEDLYIPQSDTVWGTPAVYRIKGPDNTIPCPNVLRFAHGNKLMVGAAIATGPAMTDIASSQLPIKVRIYDITDMSNPTDISLDLGSAQNNSSYYCAMYSSSKNGYFVIQNTNPAENIANIINIETGSVTKLENVSFCYAIEDTDLCVYNNTSDTSTYTIYDMSTNAIAGSFTLPTDHDNVNAIFGLRDHVYIRTTSSNGSTTYLDMYDISNGQISECMTTCSQYSYAPLILDSMNKKRIRLNACDCIQYCDDVIVLHNYGGTSKSIFITYSDPLNSHEMYLSGGTGYDLYTHNSEQCYTNFTDIKPGLLTYPIVDPNNNEHQKRIFLANLLSPYKRINYDPIYYDLGIQSKRMVVADIGYIADHANTGPREAVPDHFVEYNDTYWGSVYWNDGIIIFGADGQSATWYSIELFIPHQLTGTTKTIQCWNNPVALHDKSLSIQRSNRLSFTENNVTHDIDGSVAPVQPTGLSTLSSNFGNFIWGSLYYSVNTNTKGWVYNTEGRRIVTLLTQPYQYQGIKIDQQYLQYQFSVEAIIKEEYQDKIPVSNFSSGNSKKFNENIRWGMYIYKDNDKKTDYEYVGTVNVSPNTAIHQGGNTQPYTFGENPVEPGFSGYGDWIVVDPQREYPTIAAVYLYWYPDTLWGHYTQSNTGYETGPIITPTMFESIKIKERHKISSDPDVWSEWALVVCEIPNDNSPL